MTFESICFLFIEIYIEMNASFKRNLLNIYHLGIYFESSTILKMIFHRFTLEFKKIFNYHTQKIDILILEKTY
jgi:hypothetical protein